MKPDTLSLQMVDRLDGGLVPASVGAQTYTLLHDLVARAIFQTHVEGKLKVCLPTLFRPHVSGHSRACPGWR